MLLELTVGNLIEAFGGRRWDRAEILRQVARRITRFQKRGLAPKIASLCPATGWSLPNCSPSGALGLRHSRDAS
jgi:hypothetical protein